MIHLSNLKKLLKLAYPNTDAYSLSLKAQQNLNASYDGYIYGGATVDSYYQILQYVHVQPKDVFIDLGSGIGEKVIITSLMHPTLKRAIGIEKLPLLHDSGVYAYKSISLIPATTASPIRFIRSDYLNVPLEKVDIVYISIHPPVLEIQLQGELLSNLLCLKIGSRVLTTQVPIVSKSFKLIWKKPYTHKHGEGIMYLSKRI